MKTIESKHKRGRRSHDLFDHEQLVTDIICLSAGTIWQREATPFALQVDALEGSVWITNEGDTNDYITGVGDSIILDGAGRIVIESLTPFSLIRIVQERYIGGWEKQSDIPG